MLHTNSDRIMALLKPDDCVLDIGGWAHPFNRANFIMDAEPYQTRGYYNRIFAKKIPPIGGLKEYFSAESWIQRDVCSREPYPFADKELDYVICSHTLEDLRDPLWVCSEMIRIGKRGYVEVPSRLWESCRGNETGIAGLSHHRWLIEIEGTRIRFVQKFHRIHNWECSLPASVLKSLSEEQSVTWLYWDDAFEYEELFFHGDSQIEFLTRYIDKVRPYPKILTGGHNLVSDSVSFVNRAVKAVMRRVSGDI
jgi:Methionine biosynthesis protein MetW